MCYIISAIFKIIFNLNFYINLEYHKKLCFFYKNQYKFFVNNTHIYLNIIHLNTPTTTNHFN
jgi:hypothetical protein